VKRLFCVISTSALTLALAACNLNNGSSASPPPWDTTNGNGATAGDGRVKLEWTPTAGVEYWLFTASDAALTAFNWISLANSHAYVGATSPYYVCGMYNDTTYYFATNGRIDRGPGGPSSSTIDATPYNAATHSNGWRVGDMIASSINGLGYASLTTCGNNALISAEGKFAAVGANGAIYTSVDGKTGWTPWPIPNFTANLNAITGYAANQNNSTDPALRWIAVGDGGAVAYFDGSTWLEGSAPGSAANPNTNTLNAITHVASVYTAVGNAGTIMTSSDGITWSSHTASSGTTNNLHGVTHGIIYVAVGDAGTIITSGDGATWSAIQNSPTTNNLHQVSAFTSIYGTIYVAVGDAGTVVVSKDGGATWTAATTPPATTAALTGIAVESQVSYVATPVADTSLGFITTAQFVAVDANGNAYTSVNGYVWTTAVATGATDLAAMVSSGFGYLAAGNSGVTSYAF
jgi:hypothetical protein